MNKLIKIFLTTYLLFLFNSSIAQDNGLEGTYDYSGNFVTIENNKMTILVSVNEFYGQPKTQYSYLYKIDTLNSETIYLTLVKSKIVSGPKKM